MRKECKEAEESNLRSLFSCSLEWMWICDYQYAVPVRFDHRPEAFFQETN